MPRPALPAAILVLTLAACGHSTTPTPPAAVPATTTAVATDPPVIPATTQPSAAPAETPLAGTQYAFFKSADLSKKTVTFDLIEWFEGDKAAAACKADGVAGGDDDWCTGWYFRNNNKKLRTLPLAPGAHLTALDMTDAVKEVPATLAKFKAALDATHHVFKFFVAGGAITKAEEVYTP